MKQKPIKELIQGFKISWLAEQTGINYNTLQSQLNPNHANKLTLENELKIRQLLTK